MQRLAVLGSTGSIGTTSLEIADRHAEQFDIVALAAGSQWETLVSQTQRFRPQVVSLATEDAAWAYREAMGTDAPTVLVGDDGLNAVAAHADADLVINGLTGGVGVVPTISAIRAGKNVALANKEVLVIAGEIVNEEARINDVSLLPVDSEISAIWQCLAAGKHEEVRRILLTASGGAFRNLNADELHGVTPERALEHPNWVMGPKVTIDSATLMNKGFEIIEVRWLFDVPLEKIEVLLHHQSVIHSLVEYLDGSVIGQLGVPDMTLPIQYALTYPNRVDTHPDALDLAAIGSLTFGTPDTERFPALSLAREASRIGGTMPAVLSGADEVAVQAFLDKRIPFVGIPELVEATMERHDTTMNPSLDDVLEAERWARLEAERRIEDVA
jgi:1-deoxy-D-xylulose-5-phosphate reductoisomerase